MLNITPAQRLIVGVDTHGPARKPFTEFSELEPLIDLIQQLLPLGVTLKIRPDLLYRFGMYNLFAIGLRGEHLFIDAKLHDIGSSSARDLKLLIDAMQPHFVTCHTLGSRNMLSQLKKTAVNTTTKLVGVTVTTDVDSDTDEAQETYGRTVLAQTATLVKKGRAFGSISHTVCSAHEARYIKPLYPKQVLMTPGIRPLGFPARDQKRTATPTQAIHAGADYLVVAEAITAAPSPVEAAQAIITEIAQALATRQF